MCKYHRPGRCRLPSLPDSLACTLVGTTDSFMEDDEGTGVIFSIVIFVVDVVVFPGKVMHRVGNVRKHRALVATMQ